MSAQTLFDKYKLNLGKAKFNFSADAFKVALSNVLPVQATAEIIGDITQIGSGNGYTTGGNVIPNVSISQTAGVATAIGDAVVFTASGGSIATFQYAVVYDSTTGYLIGFANYGSAVTITAGNTFTVLPNNALTGGALDTIS